jgi:hypothetical protein
LEEYWTEVVRKSRGKHPRKKFQWFAVYGIVGVFLLLEDRNL